MGRQGWPLLVPTKQWRGQCERASRIEAARAHKLVGGKVQRAAGGWPSGAPYPRLRGIAQRARGVVGGGPQLNCGGNPAGDASVQSTGMSRCITFDGASLPRERR